jgi:hypothetical protein
MNKIYEQVLIYFISSSPTSISVSFIRLIHKVYGNLCVWKEVFRKISKLLQYFHPAVMQ